jgi:hypothetical protein
VSRSRSNRPAEIAPAPTVGRGLRRAWAAHLGAYEWHHFATLTSRTPRSRTGLVREWAPVFVRRLERRAQRRIDWYVAAERGASGEWHLHALLYGTGALSTADVERAWKIGHTRVRVYDPNRGAAGYVAKAVLDSDAWYDVSRRPPPLRAVVPARTSDNSGVRLSISQKPAA